MDRCRALRAVACWPAVSSGHPNVILVCATSRLYFSGAADPDSMRAHRRAYAPDFSPGRLVGMNVCVVECVLIGPQYGWKHNQMSSLLSAETGFSGMDCVSKLFGEDAQDPTAISTRMMGGKRLQWGTAGSKLCDCNTPRLRQ